MPTRREFEDDFGDPDRSPRSGWFARIAHVVLPVTVINVAVSAWGWFTDVPGWLGWTNTALFSVAFMAALLHQAFARICVQCMEEVPADAPVRAQRRRYVLWFVHRTQPLKAYLLMWLGALALTAGLRYAFYHGLPVEDARDNWTSAPVTLLILLVVYGMVLHHRLQPWCPFCRRWDEGGDHECTPTPDPSATKVA